MKEIGIFYGSTMGETEEAAEMIADVIGKDKAEVYNVGSVTVDEVEKYDKLIFGSSTWGLGELQDDWDTFIEKLKTLDLSNKKVALFGLGDQAMYSDTFVDAMGIIYDVVKEKGAEVIGGVLADDYDFNHSEALINDAFVGLPLDNNNQGDLTEERIRNWVDDLLKAF
ncbi:flavodoxin [Halocella sp. SP3-1]|uniref:flavodoxin n=1 Tax=Halocella sp. SP3-1 TaxID=2382161 RepID=UPI000F7576E3|nr:flavodoxin [Halocella sp. SP3-1]AZO95987.1 flavodoxin [Halocella sp. SP3-1]